MTKNYFQDEELWKQVKVSQGKGKRTKELEQMLMLIAKRVFTVKAHRTPINDHQDIIQESILILLTRWKTFNCDKHDVAGPYFTEVVKRAQTEAFNKITRKMRPGNDMVPIFGSIDFLMENHYRDHR